MKLSTAIIPVLLSCFTTAQALAFVQTERKLVDESELQESLQNVVVSTADNPEIQLVSGAEKFAVYATFAADENSGIQNLYSETYTKSVNGTLHVFIHPEFYSCDETLQGTEIQDLTGACITAIRIELPANYANLDISANGRKVNGGSNLVQAPAQAPLPLNGDVFSYDENSRLDACSEDRLEMTTF